MLNAQGDVLLKIIEKNGLGILNGNMVSDKEEEWTFRGKIRNPFVDYALAEVETWKKK